MLRTTVEGRPGRKARNLNQNETKNLRSDNLFEPKHATYNRGSGHTKMVELEQQRNLYPKMKIIYLLITYYWNKATTR